MIIQDYKPNSHRYREEEAKESEKKVEKVVKGIAKVKKKSEARKFADVFISEDAANVKNYIFMDVLVPAVKKAISDIVRDGIDMILYGDSGRSKNKSNGTYVSYRSYGNSRDERHSSSNSQRSNSRFDFGDITFETRGDAEYVREQMDEIIDRYTTVTVADLYDLAGLTPPYTSNNYGWTNIRNADIARLRDGGYAIKLPRPMPIDK